MNRKERELAALMLEQLSELLGSKNCNDFWFPDDWTDKEKQIFIAEFHIHNGDPEEFRHDCLNIADFCAADLLARKLRGA